MKKEIEKKGRLAKKAGNFLVALLTAFLFLVPLSGQFTVNAADITVNDESDLINAISGASGPTIITLSQDIALTDTVMIPAGKVITLVSGNGGPFSLIGDDKDIIIVEKNGMLTLGSKVDGKDGIILTREAGKKGRGLVVRGVGVMNSGEISNNTAGNKSGGGIFVDSATFTMNGGRIYKNDGEVGAGIGADNSVLTINGGKIYNNNGLGGAGVSSNMSSLDMNGGEIYENSGDWFGGGVICNKSTCSFSGVKIYNNKAQIAGGMDISDSETVIKNSEIYGNSASSGGGFYSHDGNLSITGSKIYNNKGGGIAAYGMEVTITDSEIYNNSGSAGGGISTGGDQIILSNVKIYRNSAEYYGGGILSSMKTTIINGGEFYENTAGDRGGFIYAMGEIKITAGKIYKNQAGTGGAIFTEDFSNLYIDGDNVSFAKNKADGVYDRDPANDADYMANIVNMNGQGKWTAPFTQGFNNYDISQIYGEKKYLLNYETNGGTPEILPDIMAENDLLKDAKGFSAIITKTNHAFENWYMDEALTQAVGDTVITDGDLTLYANWLEVEPEPTEPGSTEPEIDKPGSDTGTPNTGDSVTTNTAVWLIMSAALVAGAGLLLTKKKDKDQD